ncbi:hypothetical protein VRK_39340 [Vibrio sp. MEBiC08052]|nr:hypothetical protein VRK_39340 [Vibrio sp. MEBiC08052]
MASGGASVTVSMVRSSDYFLLDREIVTEVDFALERITEGLIEFL